MRALNTVLLALGFVLAFGMMAMAFAAPPDAIAEPMGYAHALLESITHRAWPVMAGLLLIGVTALIRHFGKKKVPWLGTKAGGWVLVLVLAFGAGIGDALIEGGKWASVTTKVLVDALVVFGLAVTGHTAIKDAKTAHKKKKAAKAN